jgi:peptide/nickel transport system substrate-binding protein
MTDQRWFQIATRSSLFVLLVLGLVSCGQRAVPPTAQPLAASTQGAPTALAPTQLAPSERGSTAAVPTTAAAQPADTQPAANGQQSSITIVIPEDPPSFNPVISDTGYDALVKNLVLLGLTGVDAHGQVYPVLAAELPTEANGGVKISQDSSTMDVTWKLRSDVTWADGEPVTADDVVFTYEALVKPDTGAWVEGIDSVQGLEKIDAHAFVIHFNAIYPGYLTLFGGVKGAIWPKHYCQADEGFSAWACARQPLSDGPYSLKEWVTGDHLTFVRNPKYFEPGKPQIEKIVVRIVPDLAVRETMLRQGDADVIMWANEQIVNGLASEPKVKVSLSQSSRFVMRLFMNLAAKGTTDPVASPNPFLADVRVRQAMRQAIDVETILKSVWQGYGTPVWTEFFRPPYVCDIPRPKFDVAGAQALLEAAGWIDKDGDGIRECHGCQNAKEGDLLKFDLNIYAEYGEPLDLTQQLIGEMLAKVGMQVNLSSVQGSVLWADTASGGIEQLGNFNIDLYDDGYKGLDPTPFLYQYYSSGSMAPDAGWNVGRWKNDQFDTLLAETYTLDEARRKDAFCQMAKLLDDELPQILLFSTINADAYAQRLAGVQANINDVVTWNVASWTLAQ